MTLLNLINIAGAIKHGAGVATDTSITIVFTPESPDN